MKNARYVSRKGFTLVELLIVIVVIGVLSAMMIMSASEAVSTAKVATMISNLRNLKTAVTAWYFDNTDKIEIGSNGIYRVIWGGKVAPVQEFWESRTTAQGMESIKTEILKYMSNTNAVNKTGTGWSNGKQKSMMLLPAVMYLRTTAMIRLNTVNRVVHRLRCERR